jgi:dTDP-4-dehydrorhamnose reductase
MTSILMFGATGQVALCLLDRVAVRQIPVTALSRAQADLRDLDAIARAIAEAPADCLVVNAAAYTAVDNAETDSLTAEAVNALAPEAMAIACAARGLPLVHISTDYVFDGTKEGAYVEDDPTAPQGVYGLTKLDGERRVLAAHPAAIIIRTAWVYSPHGKNFVKTMLRLGAERDALSVVADQIGCPTSAHDIAEAVLSLADTPTLQVTDGGIYHFAGSGSTSWAEFAEAVFDLSAPVTGRRPSVTPIASSDYPTPAKRPANSRLNSDKFAARFGYRAPQWRDSLAAVLDALISTGAPN